MTPNTPAFLLIMPSYNQAHYIASAVDSILRQQDTNWVLWIVDNSSDNTPEVMRAYDDPRIHFLHIPKRMDPGTCLNMVLEQEGHKHRDFSYVHTDNLLRADYVGKMRQALSHDERSLAYCDMKSLDARGEYTGIFRRGSFDLARLFSFSSLGVPFSATTQLSRELGAFNRMDVADDVIFCVRAWPKARFEYVADAIMDYRTHDDSRTIAHGGATEIERSFLNAYQRLLPEMMEQGIDPIAELANRLKQLQIDIELVLEHLWLQQGGRAGTGLASPSLDALCALDLLNLCDLNSPVDPALDPPDTGLRRIQGKIRKRWRKIRSGLRLEQQLPQSVHHNIPRSAVWELSTQFRQHVIPWLYLAASRLGAPEAPMRIASTDIYTLWSTLALNRMCGWRFQLAPGAQVDRAKWPQLDSTASGDTALIDISVAPDNIWVSRTH